MTRRSHCCICMFVYACLYMHVPLAGRRRNTLSRAHWIDRVAVGMEEQALAGSNTGDTTRVTL